MSVVLYSFYTILHLVLLVWGVLLWRRTRRIGTLVIAAVTFGLVYDNLILSIGRVLDEGQLLYTLSVPRFMLHQLVLPWIIYASFEQVRLAGYQWAKGATARWAAISFSSIAVVLGILTRIVPMDLQPMEMDGINRYVAEGVVGPPIVSIFAIGFAGVMGLLLWQKNGWAGVFLTAILVFIGEGIPVEMVRRTVGSGAEVLFMLAMLMIEQRFEGEQTSSLGSA
jgi:hypothetical protein